MRWTLDDILPAIAKAGDDGLTLGTIKTKLPKKHHAALPGTLKSLVDGGDVRGPFQRRGSQVYFAAGHGPSVETTRTLVAAAVKENGTRLTSLAGLRGKITGLHKPFVDDAIRDAVASRMILELRHGSAKFYLHRDVAQEYFAFDEAAAPEPVPAADLTMAAVLPAYARLKSEQGGYGTVKIFDLMNALGVGRETLHRFLLREAKAGRLTIHPTTSVELPPEVIEAGIKIPGHADPYVTVVVPDAP
ncbi:hypothetical protein A33M_3469 [Rhodovulum sp. PH10]|uniref:hypothetical protein n=1 Tax=Rhodovulum sp. PH10 TaxID=1187851 RepID=UPI00027C2C56|nr:hypothetical protein [Rhodovulum sp. PH10]EJW11115.1 hypothetical protein A33M_3469 [Rhodovulum sp. PH10]